jgi:hypothetical protein
MQYIGMLCGSGFQPREDQFQVTPQVARVKIQEFGVQERSSCRGLTAAGPNQSRREDGENYGVSPR